MPSDAEGWWETERAKLIRSRILAAAPDHGLTVDIGCGRGTMLDHPSLDGLRRVQVDSHVWCEWTPRPDQYFVCARADALPFRSGSFNVVASFDVLEHLENDDIGLSEQRRIVRDEGTVLTAVPADQRLWSRHDEEVGHYRRYSTRELADLAARCGLIIDHSSHFFSFLWIPARVLRNSTARTSEPGNDDSVANRLIRLIVRALCSVERAIMRCSALPLGTSIWVESRPANGKSSDQQPGRMRKDDLGSTTLPATTTKHEEGEGMTFRDRLLGTSSGYWSLKRVIASDQANATIVEEYLDPAADEAILDVGCGVGDVARYMGAASYHGVDQNPRYIERATSQNYTNATFVNASVEELPELGLTLFDKVLIIGVLHHLDDARVASLMEHLPRVMKPDGRLVVAENAWVADQRTMARVLIALDRGRYVRSIAEYERFIKPHFDEVGTDIRHDLLRVPYTYVVTTARARSTSRRVDAGAPSAPAL